MAISLELMDTDTGNLVGSYATLEEALAIVRTTFSAFAESGIQGLSLILIREDGTQQLVSEDLDLARFSLGREMTTLSS